MPIPADKNIERLNIYENNSAIYDLFFTMSHGVNRGVLKGNKRDERDPFIDKLINSTLALLVPECIYGFAVIPPSTIIAVPVI